MSVSGCCRCRLTAAAICLGVNLQTWRERVLKEVHVEVVVALNGFLNAQLKNVGEVAGGVEPQIDDGISDAEKQNVGGENTSKNKTI